MQQWHALQAEYICLGILTTVTGWDYVDQTFISLLPDFIAYY